LVSGAGLASSAGTLFPDETVMSDCIVDPVHFAAA